MKSEIGNPKSPIRDMQSAIQSPQSEIVRVLLIEDNPGDARLIREMLVDVGDAFVQLECADRLRTGLERLATGGIDALLLDLSLPDSRGIETFCKAYAQAPEVATIVLTGLDDEGQALRAVREGAQDYLVKGEVNGHLLVRSLQYAIERKRTEKERARLLAETERNLQRISTLYEIGLATTSTLDLQAILELLMEKIDLLLPHSTATSVRLLNKGTGMLEPIAHWHLGEREWRVAAGQGRNALSKTVFENKAPLIIANVKTDSRIRDRKFFSEHGFVTYLGVPLIAKGEVLGVLAFLTKEKHEFRGDEVKFFTTLAGQAAIAIHNSQLFEQVERKTHELSALYDVATVFNQSLDLHFLLRSLMHKVLEIFEFDAARIYLFDTSREELRLLAQEGFHKEAIPRSYKAGEGIIGRVVDKGEPLLFENIQNDPEFHRLARKKFMLRAGFQGSFFIPIRVKNKAVGVLNCVSKSVHHFSFSDAQLIQSIADHLGIAVENAQLFEETKRQAIQLQQDIAQRKLAESQLKQANSNLEKSHEDLKAAQLQLIQAAKLESIGKLAAGVAHEVKNPLEIILMSVEYLSKTLTDRDEQTGMLLDDIEYAVRRADSVVHGLLDFSASDKLHAHNEELNIAIERSLHLVKHELDKSHVTLVRKLSAGLPPVMLDTNKIQQVFVNLFINAIHAMPGGGTLAVKTHMKQWKEIDYNLSQGRQDHFNSKDAVLIAEIEDTGTGIPEDKLSKVFDPFFTTKPTGKGTGLGLTVVNKIIELHGGIIDIRNREEGGVRTSIILMAQKGNNYD